MKTQRPVPRRLLVAAAALIAAVVALGAASVGPLTPLFNRPIPIAENGGVVAVDMRPFPEGPPFPGVELAEIKQFIPDPLPAPLNNWFCQYGGNLIIYLGHGREVVYGPCRRPASIDRLLDEMARHARQRT